MDKTFAICFALAVFGLSALFGMIFIYDYRSNAQFAALLKDAKDPLAVRCAWTGDQQVCQIVGIKR